MCRQVFSTGASEPTWTGREPELDGVTHMGKGTTRKLPSVGLEPGAADAPRITVEWLDRGHHLVRVGPHDHPYLELIYFERGGGRHRIGPQGWEVSAGDLFLVAPGEVHDAGELEGAEGWVVGFSADAIALEDGASPFLSWRTNPLLYPFVRPAGGQVGRFTVPERDRPRWYTRLRAMDSELRAREPGYQEAVRAYLTLLLVDVGRLAQEVAGHLRIQEHPVLAEVFEFIGDHYAEPVSLADVAAAVRLSPGYLTTLVRRRTGRTVLEWIAERRMAEARRLLAETDETVEHVAGMVGYNDPTYFVRSFRRAHGTTPQAWRNANR
jgi:AraC family transcriptional activator of pobA